MLKITVKLETQEDALRLLRAVNSGQLRTMGAVSAELLEGETLCQEPVSQPDCGPTYKCGWCGEDVLEDSDCTCPFSTDH